MWIVVGALPDYFFNYQWYLYRRYKVDDGNKEDEEALAAGRESDVCERMVKDEG
jgi:hypothetical protein